MVEQSDDYPNQVISSVIAFTKWPQLVLRYLESIIQIRWNKVNHGRHVGFVVEETKNPVGNPIRIKCKYFLYLRLCEVMFQLVSFNWLKIFADVTEKSEILHYWVEWPSQQARFVESSIACQQWPNLVYGFLVSLLQWTDGEANRTNFNERQIKKSAQSTSTYYHTKERCEYLKLVYLLLEKSHNFFLF